MKSFVPKFTKSDENWVNMFLAREAAKSKLAQITSSSTKKSVGNSAKKEMKSLPDNLVARFQKLILDKRGVKLTFDQARIEAEKFTYDAIFILKQLRIIEKMQQ
jgi:hypothetical protein